jgi:iron(III) transport system ATP-binding protein
MSAIELRNVAKRFGTTSVLSDVGLVVPDGSITAILGASGSGKTTLLRLIAGFEQVDSGMVTIAGQIVDDGRRIVKAQHRGVGYVPQDGALFPHLTVAGNVGFGLSRGGRSTVEAMLELVGLTGLGQRYPHQLSGGQQQRIALARALAIHPKVVLLDEPFSSLDASLRVGLSHDVAQVLASTRTTTVLVTHDQDDALSLADQIAVLRDGRVAACGDPRDLYRSPPDVAAALSIGEANIVAAQIDGEYAECALGRVRLQAGTANGSRGAGRVLIRPEQLALRLCASAGLVKAAVVDLQYHGHDALVHVTLDHADHETLLARIPGDLVLAPGQAVWVEAVGTGRAWPAGAAVRP